MVGRGMYGRKKTNEEPHQGRSPDGSAHAGSGRVWGRKVMQQPAEESRAMVAGPETGSSCPGPSRLPGALQKGFPRF